MRQDVESFEDFVQYYSSRYVKGRSLGEMFHIRGSHPTERQTVLADRYVHGRLEQGDMRIRWDAIPSMVLFGLPRLGTVTFNHELLFLYYRTRRHGGRGFDANRILHTSFNRQALVELNLPVFDNGYLGHPPFVHVSMIHNHTPWNKATADLFSDTPSTPAYALSFNFGAYLSKYSDYPVLTYKTDEIGYIESPTRVVLKSQYADHDVLVSRIVPEKVEVRV